jgi:uncharacterized protein YkwD
MRRGAHRTVPAVARRGASSLARVARAAEGTDMTLRKRWVLAVGVVSLGAGCGPGEELRGAPAEAEAGAEARPQGMTYAEFLSVVHREEGTGVCVLDGDVPLEDCDDKRLRDFYETHVRADGAQGGGLQGGGVQGVSGAPLAVNRTGAGTDDRWSETARRGLTYCVSTAFGTRHAAVVQAMAAAAAAWEAVAGVDFTHVPAQDASCTASNTAVLFDVNPVSSGGQYAARAFFPSSGRAARNVLVDGSAFSAVRPDLTGILRHELGHVLGFRHEHTRPEAATCFEDTRWRALTPYDSASVMHYPQCNGTGSALTLTALDAEGARALYGAPGAAPAPAPAGTPVTQTFSGTLARGQQAFHGPLAVLAGTTLEVVMTGSGDPDLYVRFGAAPTLTAYACRPYRTGAAETCRLTVPAGQGAAHLLVHGYAAGTYALTVTRTEPATPPAPDALAPTFAGLASAAAAGTTRVDLAWAPATDDVTPQAGLVYDVYVSTTQPVPLTTPAFTTAPGAASAQVAGLQPGTLYAFVVRARDAAGNRDGNLVERTATTALEAPPTDAAAALEARVLELVNQRRAAGATCGTTAYAAAAPLAADARLQSAARLHSQDMAARNYFSHTSQDGRTVGQRLAAAGYTGGTWGENIAAGQATAEAVVQGWMASAGHCANIMNPTFRLLGVGYATSATSTYRHYWTQDFGR